jgi:hypothetical protein
MESETLHYILRADSLWLDTSLGKAVCQYVLKRHFGVRTLELILLKPFE